MRLLTERSPATQSSIPTREVLTHLGLDYIPTAIIGSMSQMVREQEICAYIREGKVVWATTVYAQLFSKQPEELHGVAYQSVMCAGMWGQRDPYIKQAIRGKVCQLYVTHNCTGQTIKEFYIPNFKSQGQMDGFFVVAFRCQFHGPPLGSEQPPVAPDRLLKICRAE